MIGTNDGYWFSFKEVPGTDVILTIHRFNETLIEETCVPNGEVTNVFDMYVSAERKAAQMKEMKERIGWLVTQTHEEDARLNELEQNLLAATRHISKLITRIEKLEES